MNMTTKQKETIQYLFRVTKKTYHRLADEAGIGERPDKFEDISFTMAQKIIDAQACKYLYDYCEVGR